MTNSSDEREVLKAQLKNAATDKNMADLQRIYDYVFGEDDNDSSLPSNVVSDVLKIVEAYRDGKLVIQIPEIPDSATTVTDSLMSVQDKKN